MQPRYHQARTIAEILRRTYRLEPPVELEKLFDPFHIIYREESFPNDVSGFVLPLPNYPDWFLLAVNRDHSPGRRRFTIAHELGHIVMHHIPTRIEMRSDLKEKEANAFAADLLMPADEVKRLAAAGKSAPQMAEIFGVSREAIRVRLSVLGITCSEGEDE